MTAPDTSAPLARAGGARRRNKSKAIGTKAETAVARYLAANGFPHAEKRRPTGALDQGDITGTPGICWEVKGGEAARNASDLQVDSWLIEAEVERGHAGARYPVLVVQRRGVGYTNAGRWWAVMYLSDVVELSGGPRVRDAWGAAVVRMQLGAAVQLLRAAGFGQPLEDDEVPL